VLSFTGKPTPHVSLYEAAAKDAITIYDVLRSNIPTATFMRLKALMERPVQE
jgi:hypothetical protein